MNRRVGWRIWLVVFAVVLVLPVVGLRQYLVWGGATGILAEGITKQAGSAVTLSSSRITLLGDTSLTGLKLYDADQQDVVLQADQVRVDVNAVGYALGRREPRRVAVEGGRLRLRFDAAGKLLTRLGKSQSTGGSYPRLRLSNCDLTIEQLGRPPFTLHGIDLTFDPDRETNLTGTIDDPAWGNWTVSARLTAGTGEISAHAETTNVEFTQAKLEALPFLPRPVLKQVRKVHGRTSANLTVDLNANHGIRAYRAEVHVLPTRVFVPAVDLAVDDVTGRVVLKDGRVWLKDLRARVAGGELSTTAEVDLHQQPWRLNFRIKSRGLALNRLPKKWELPTQIEGKLRGEAQVAVLVRGKRIESLIGHGLAHVDDAKVLGFPTSDPVLLTLETDREGLRFVTPPQSPTAASRTEGEPQD